MSQEQIIRVLYLENPIIIDNRLNARKHNFDTLTIPIHDNVFQNIDGLYFIASYISNIALQSGYIFTSKKDKKSEQIDTLYKLLIDSAILSLILGVVLPKDDENYSNYLIQYPLDSKTEVRDLFFINDITIEHLSYAIFIIITRLSHKEKHDLFSTQTTNDKRYISEHKTSVVIEPLKRNAHLITKSPLESLNLRSPIIQDFRKSYSNLKSNYKVFKTIFVGLKNIEITLQGYNLLIKDDLSEILLSSKLKRQEKDGYNLISSSEDFHLYIDQTYIHRKKSSITLENFLFNFFSVTKVFRVSPRLNTFNGV